MKKSTSECRKDCDVYEAWKKLEADNAELVLDNMRMKELETTIKNACDLINDEGEVNKWKILNLLNSTSKGK